MNHCVCGAPHEPRKIVLTGGPGAGKTAFLELIRHSFCRHVKVLPEAAGIIFGGGFPREKGRGVRRAAQRAIFFVQRELEAAALCSDAALVLCDRGTVDGAAYWPGPGDMFSSVGTTLEEQLKRYDAVIHLSPPVREYNRQNPLRVETADEAAAIDKRIAQAWAGHPRYFRVEASPDFLTKASHALAILRAEIPVCCRQHLVPLLDAVRVAS